MTKGKTFREKATEYFISSGYHDLTEQERIESNQKCIERLGNVEKHNYAAGKRLLKELRGG